MANSKVPEVCGGGEIDDRKVLSVQGELEDPRLISFGQILDGPLAGDRVTFLDMRGELAVCCDYVVLARRSDGTLLVKFRQSSEMDCSAFTDGIFEVNDSVFVRSLRHKVRDGCRLDLAERESSLVVHADLEDLHSWVSGKLDVGGVREKVFSVTRWYQRDLWDE